jgi:hypothetical protein
MRAFASPFRGTAPNASVLLGVELVGADLTLVDNGRIDLSFFAIDSKGQSHGFRSDSPTTVNEPGLPCVTLRASVRIKTTVANGLPVQRWQSLQWQ